MSRPSTSSRLISSRRGAPSRAGPQPQIVNLYAGALRHQHRAFDGMVQLADIARPGMRQQRFHGSVFEAGQILAVMFGMLP